MEDELAFAGPAGQGATGAGNVPCAVCGAKTAMCCSACEAVFYCSAACQARDWKEHWKVCGTQTQTQTPGSPAQAPRARSPGAPATSEDGDGYQVALPPSNFAQAAAAEAAATAAARDRRLRLRVSAVLAARENRHHDALQHAAEAYEVAQRLGSLYSEGKLMADEGGIAELEGPAVVELVIIVRAALAVNDFGTGLGFLEMLTATVDRLAGVGGNPSILQPSEAATLLYSTAELCSLYNHEERAEDYAHAYLGVVRLAHGEGSKEVGDAHGFLCALFTRRKRYDEAVLHASSTLRIRQRHASYGAEKPVADAYWNLSVLQYQLGQHRAALDSLEASREIHVRVSGEGVATANVDMAIGQVWTTLGEATKAMRAYRQAVRLRQRTLGFAHAETRRAASLLAAAEIEAHAEDEWRKDLEAEAEEAGPIARPRPRQRPVDPDPEMPQASSGQYPAVRDAPTHQAYPPMALQPQSPDSLQMMSAISPSSPELSRMPRPAAASPIEADTPGRIKTASKNRAAQPAPKAAFDVSLKVQNIEYADLRQESDLLEAFSATVKRTIASEARVPTENVDLQLSPGSILVRARVALPEGERHSVLTQANRKKLELGLMQKLRELPGLAEIASDSIVISEIFISKPSLVDDTQAQVLPLSAQDGVFERVAGEHDKPLGLTPSRVPPGQVFLKTVMADSWAERSGFKPGMELLAINGKDLKIMTAEEFKMSLRTMPVTIRVGPGKTAASSVAATPVKQVKAQLSTFQVPDSTRTIGCLFTSVPPGPVYIRQVDLGSWAEERACKVGWELVAVNGEACNTMSADAFRTAMRARPLTLAFDPKAQPTLTELDKQGWRPSIVSSEDRPVFPAASSLASEYGRMPVDEVSPALSRKETIAALFRQADVRRSGRLMRAEMWCVARVFGCKDSEEKFQEEYDELCDDFECSPEAGIDMGAFERILQEVEDYSECSDETLRSRLQMLRAAR